MITSKLMKKAKESAMDAFLSIMELNAELGEPPYITKTGKLLREASEAIFFAQEALMKLEVMGNDKIDTDK